MSHLIFRIFNFPISKGKHQGQSLNLQTNEFADFDNENKDWLAQGYDERGAAGDKLRERWYSAARDVRTRCDTLSLLL